MTPQILNEKQDVKLINKYINKKETNNPTQFGCKEIAHARKIWQSIISMTQLSLKLVNVVRKKQRKTSASIPPPEEASLSSINIQV